MKKLLCILCLLLALVCVFAACDKSETPSTGNNNVSTNQTGGNSSGGGSQSGDNQGGDQNSGNQSGDQGGTTTHTHAFGEWETVTAATCIAKGEEKRTCTCGEIETREIAMLAHAYGDWAVSKAATCSAKGEEKRTCTCGESETRETQATGIHTSGADGFCTACDQPLAPTEGVIYDLSNDRFYAMVMGYTGEAKRVIIADTYMDKPVKEIYSEAFKNTSITAVVIPASVTSIGRAAFYKCASLESITLPADVTSIGEELFKNCKSLASITIPAGVKNIGESAFENCESLKNVMFEDNSQMTSIGVDAFTNCSNLTNITLPATLISIGSGAFEDCPSIASITIPASVTSIGRSAFEDGTSLASVTFENKNGWTAGNTSISATDLGDLAKAATYLKSTYSNYTWTRTKE